MMSALRNALSDFSFHPSKPRERGEEVEALIAVAGTHTRDLPHPSSACHLFSFPADIVISSLRATTTEVVLHIECRRPCAACPLCQQHSARVHGHYGCAGDRVKEAMID
jgi:hypothetical protein